MTFSTLMLMTMAALAATAGTRVLINWLGNRADPHETKRIQRIILQVLRENGGGMEKNALVAEVERRAAEERRLENLAGAPKQTHV